MFFYPDGLLRDLNQGPHGLESTTFTNELVLVLFYYFYYYSIGGGGGGGEEGSI